jgi:RND family efflux transporter MFP subunit
MHVRIWIAGLGLAAAGLFAGADDRIFAGGDPPQSVPEGAIVLKECTIKASQTARVATDRPGVIAVVHAKEGDAVKEGEEIVHLMDEVPQANWEVAKLVADDRIEVEYATKLNAVDALEYIKSVEANNKAPGTISEIELRRLKLAEQRSFLQIDKAKHDMAVNVMKAKQAKTELDTYHIMAPFDGTVSQVLKFRGEAVKQGDTILEMVNTDIVHVEGKVRDKDILRIKRGSPVTVVLDIEGADPAVSKQVFQGKVDFVDPVATATDTRVWAQVPNPGNVLRPGFFATMTILAGPVKDPKAGQGALERRNSKVVVRREAVTP